VYDRKGADVYYIFSIRMAQVQGEGSGTGAGVDRHMDCATTSIGAR
jgi:hypothetical protein